MDVKLCAGTALLLTSGAAGTVLRSENPVRAGLSTWFALFAAQYLLLKVYRLVIRPNYLSPLRHLPGPKDDRFLLGQTLDLFKDSNPNSAYLAWSQQWPDAPLIRYKLLGGVEMLLVNSLAAHREVTQTQCYSFVRPGFFGTLLGEFLGSGLLMADEAAHRRQRRLLGKPFSPPNLRRLLPVFQAKTADLLRRIDEAIGDGRQAGVLDMEAEFIETTLDIMGEAGLGIDIKGLIVPGTNGRDFSQCYHALLAQPPLGGFITFLNLWVPMRWLPIEANMAFVRANHGIRRMITSFARERAAALAAGEKRKGGQENETKDLLTYMVEANLENEECLTEKELVDNLLQFMAAGHETSAAVLAWAAYELAKHPAMQTRLREEVLTVGEQPDVGQLESLSYLNNFVRELVRRDASSLIVPREAVEDVVVDGVAVPKGTLLMMVPAVPQRNRRIWGDDADVFDPDRWDRLAGDATSPYAIGTFTNGPRICIGKNFAMLEMKVILAALVRGFAFEMTDELQTVQYTNPALTLRRKGGMPVRLRRL